MIDFKQIEKLDIKWPVYYDEVYFSIHAADDWWIADIITSQPFQIQHAIGHALAATLNAFHNDPKRFWELIESK